MFSIDRNKVNNQEIFLSKVLFLLELFVVFALYLIVEKGQEDLYNKLSMLGVVGWFVLGSFFLHYKNITKVFITPITILVLSMFAFSYGQVLLFGLGINYKYFFLNEYYASIYNNDLNLLLDANFYTLMCLSVFCVGVLTSIKAKNNNLKTQNKTFEKFMQKAFLILFFISVIPYLAYNVYLVSYSFSYGYSQSLKLTQPAIIRYVGVFFVPSSIGAIISCKNNKNKQRIVIFLTIINCIFAFFIGGRSFAFGLIIGLIVIIMMDKKISTKTILALLVGAFILATISVSVADYRTTDGISFVETIINNLLQENIIISFLGEAGFSGSSIVWTMELIRSGHETFDGMTYIGSIVGLIPSTLDVLKIFQHFEYYTQLEGILTEQYSFNFGVGFSLIAESFLNFKWFGIVPIFFEAIIFGKLLNIYKDSNLWRKYVAIVMMTVLLTIPRRDIVFLSNQFTLCVIFPYIFIKVLNYIFGQHTSANIKERNKR